MADCISSSIRRSLGNGNTKDQICRRNKGKNRGIRILVSEEEQAYLDRVAIEKRYA